MSKARTKQYNLVSLFSGCGGSSLGYKMAGFKILLASEFIPIVRQVYKANFPDTPILENDIRKTTGKEILDTIGLKKGEEVDVLDGSPPCSPFSKCGVLEDGWRKVKHYSEGIKQRTDDLYFEYIRILKEVQPRIFLSENVDSLTHGKAKGYFNNIFQEMQKAGYNVKAAILNAKNFNVPQSRNRLFFMGIRKDLKLEPSFPVSNGNAILTVRNALTNLKNTRKELDEAGVLKRRKTMYSYARILKQGEAGAKYHPKGHFFGLIRQSWSKPASTLITTAGSMLVHPAEDRYFTISELKRLHSFPDSFILLGSYMQRQERIARSVPPNLMLALATKVRMLLQEIDATPKRLNLKG